MLGLFIQQYLKTIYTTYVIMENVNTITWSQTYLNKLQVQFLNCRSLSGDYKIA